MLTRILIAMDSHESGKRIQGLLRGQGLQFSLVQGRDSIWSRLKQGDVDLLIAGGSGEWPDPVWVRSVRGLPESPEVVVLMRRESASQRADLLAAGALGILQSDLPESSLREALLAFVHRSRDLLAAEAQARVYGERPSLRDFISESEAMRQFMETVERVVDSSSSLLLLGETGSGKERLAQAIHNESPRSREPFMAVNCGALSESLLESELFGHEEGAFTGATRTRRGYFELAHQGTLFLDEIGEMPLHLQVKLLRVLEERRIQRVGGEKSLQVNVRVMAASNRDLEREVAEKRFRADLFFRLAVVTLEIPPLRDRREDIPKIVDSYLAHFNEQIGRRIEEVQEDALDALLRHTWPGNVRELVNTMERAVLLCKGATIGLSDLPPALRPGAAAAEAGSTIPDPPGGTGIDPAKMIDRPLPELREEWIDALERSYLVAMLASTQGRVGDAAERAGLSERTLYNLMRKHGLDKASFRRSGDE